MDPVLHRQSTRDVATGQDVRRHDVGVSPVVDIPEGFVDREQARRMFGITLRQWKRWVSNGTVRCGVIVPSRVGGRCLIFPIEALRQLREELFARDTLYNNASGNYHVPPGWSRRHEACRMFGVDRATWERWRGEGILPSGERFDGGPTLYRVEDIKHVMYRDGRLAPPYPDPDGSGTYRVPLCGRDAGRGADGREAVIDVEWLPLLDGAALTWEVIGGPCGEVGFVCLCRPDEAKRVALRRVVTGVTDRDVQVGHVNGDPLDCRRANLVVRTIQQRTQSARKMRGIKGRPCTSRFKGVCFESWTQKWRANIEVNGKRRSLGRFRDEIAAAEAYDEAALQAWGEHARLNFPDGIDAYLEREAQRAEARQREAA